MSVQQLLLSVLALVSLCTLAYAQEAADVWREYYPSGSIKVLKTSSQANGRPDQLVFYSEAGSILRAEYDQQGSGRFDTIVTYEPFGGRLAETTTHLSKDGTPEQIDRLWTEADGNHRLRVEQLLRDGTVIESYEMVLPAEALAAGAPDVAPCVAGGSPVLDETQFTALLAHVGKGDNDRLQVTGCEGFKVKSKNGVETKFDGVKNTMKAHATEVLSKGIACLRGLGPSGKALGNRVLGQLLSSSKRKLTLSCRPLNTPGLCSAGSSAGRACGFSSHFDEKGYPSISLATDCGMKAEELDSNILHETLHQCGDPNHQHLHNYKDAMATEHVEPCAQCCAGGKAASAKQVYCDLCKDTPAKDPVAHNIKYGIRAMLDGEYTVARQELEKAVALDPKNAEAWSALLLIYYSAVKDDNKAKRVNPNNASRLFLAQKMVRTLVGSAASKRPLVAPEAKMEGSPLPLIYQAQRMALEPGGFRYAQTGSRDKYGIEKVPEGQVNVALRYFFNHHFRAFDSSVSLAYGRYLYNQTILKMTLQACPKMEAPANDEVVDPIKSPNKACYQRALEALKGMAAESGQEGKTKKGNIETAQDEAVAKWKAKDIAPDDRDELMPLDAPPATAKKPAPVATLRGLRDEIQRGLAAVTCLKAGTPLESCDAAKPKAAVGAAPAAAAVACKPVFGEK